MSMAQWCRPGIATSEFRAIADEQQLSIIHMQTRLPPAVRVDRRSNRQENATNVSRNFVHVSDLSMASEIDYRTSFRTLSESLDRRRGSHADYVVGCETGDWIAPILVSVQFAPETSAKTLAAVMSRVLQRPCDVVGKLPGYRRVEQRIYAIAFYFTIIVDERGRMSTAAPYAHARVVGR
jgi:hypothetical protein